MAGPPSYSHPHLELSRSGPVTQRRRPPRWGSATPMEDPVGHGRRLGDRLREMRGTPDAIIGGCDPRLLIKLEMSEKKNLQNIAKALGGVEIVSQEAETLVLAFATEEQLENFEARLRSLVEGRTIKYKDVVYAIQDLDHWTPENRKGWALRGAGFPDQAHFFLDTELWQRPKGAEAEIQRSAFRNWLEVNGGKIIDAVAQPHLTKYRIDCTQVLADRLLLHRDVRTIDLPPRYSLERALLSTDIHDLVETPPPPLQSPGIVVLDSGLTTGHPLLSSAVGDSQSFISIEGTDNTDGHGTSVGGIALYDDIAECVRNGQFIPDLRLFSGRVFDEGNSNDPLLMENQVEKAVRYFVDEYEGRIFNLSYGDLNKPYEGRHVAGLAVTLDSLSREYGVLFVVPTGNYDGEKDEPDDWHAEYPLYLTGESSALLDPAPALNVLTVGSIARYDQNPRWPNDPAYVPVARPDQPSPFTRCGPSVNGSLKPDLVDYGGNLLIDSRPENRPMTGQQGVGELSLSYNFAAGQLFKEVSGTSFAAPRVANAAARILAEWPSASANLCRAMLVAHASTPRACQELFTGDREALDAVTGYGLIDRSGLYRSLDERVTLLAEEKLENQQHHFYELPIPPEFWLGGQRLRELTVALAYCPAVRTTRMDYRAAKISFKLVQADSLDEVTDWFNAAVDDEDLDRIPERSTGRRFSEEKRSKGTVQASTWTFKKATAELRRSSWFVVISRNDPVWGESFSSQRESYALAVILSDQETHQLQLGVKSLYASVEEQLSARARARA